PTEYQYILEFLVQCFGTPHILVDWTQLADKLSPWPAAVQSLQQIQTLIDHLQSSLTPIDLHLDFTDSVGFDYYSGIDFAIYTPHLRRPLLRGGRYFTHFKNTQGQPRSAVGFSFDVKCLASMVQELAPAATLQVLWSDLEKFPNLRAVVDTLRQNGEIVVACAEFSTSKSQKRLIFDANARLGYQIVGGL
ncbi:MAG: ATP phosphoribosyltransferase regulatory subunit, partial [Gammaproteobacteria bacterium]|nr:ATP phosphoribosyltransferase regulatory subunit [Gammaproteobacteria bacterium]